ncbi:siderophore-interacting protein [Jatrophihabitans sp. YIM 134969]
MAVVRTAEHPGRIVSATSLTPLMRRIVVQAPTLPTATLLQDVAVVLPDPEEPDRRTIRRRYTVRAADPAAHTLALEAVLHGHGPGATWAQTAAPGDDVVLYGPRAGADVLTGDRVLVLADDAGLPAVLELLPHLTGAVTAVVEIAGVGEEQPVPGVGWRHRDGRPAGEPDVLVAAAAEFGATPADAAYVLAESRVTAAVREVLLAAGIPRGRLHAKGYWNREDPRRAGSSS